MSPSAERDVLGYGQQAVDEPADTVLEDRATGYGLRVAQATPSRDTAPKAKRKTATDLLISDRTYPDLARDSAVYAEQILRMKEEQRQTGHLLVSSWEELANKLGEYDTIDHLVLMFHGAPGCVQVGNTLKGLSSVSSLFTEKRPRVDKIDLEGCCIGRAPDELVAFGQLLKAKTITAFNYYWCSFSSDPFPSTADVRTIEDTLKPYEGYLLPGTPSATTIASRKKEYRPIVEWFRLVDVRDKEGRPEPLPPRPAAGDDSARKETFKPRSEARARRINFTEAEKVAGEFKGPGMPYDFMPFERVIIDLTAPADVSK